jgi:predicted Zn-dependent protease
MSRFWQMAFCSFLLVALPSCREGSRFNLFTLEQDKMLGRQVVREVTEQTDSYVVLDRSRYSGAYAYLEAIRDTILASGKVKHGSDFEWKIWIIQNDSVQNAFCAPGGYIFVYTGLIQELHSASALAGVLAHEIAHADCRHSTRQMTKKLGIQLLLSFVLGINQSVLTELAQGLVDLGFSRTDEEEADLRSVEYLCSSPYRADGAAIFFRQLSESGEGDLIPEFLSTHPSPGNRVQNIEALMKQRQCRTNADEVADSLGFRVFQQGLPQGEAWD